MGGQICPPPMWNRVKDSGPIGLSLMVVLAEGYLQTLERRAIDIGTNSNPPVAPITHVRYVDDSHDRFLEQENPNKFLNILNSIDPKIQYTMEVETEDKTLNFLDIKVKNSRRGSYEYSVYRKAAITNIQVKSNSCHYEGTLNGIFKGFIHRAKSICSPENQLKVFASALNGNSFMSSNLINFVCI